MALQTDNLVMIGLGSPANQPPNPNQSPLPPLLDGIHLRWGFRRELGFPWYGYHLFRRPANPGRLLCLSSVTGGLKKGNWPESKHYTAIGVLSSDTSLVFADDFAPANQVEFALGGRQYLRFDLPPSEMARRVELRIGFPPPKSASIRAERASPLRVRVMAYADATPVRDETRNGQAGQIVSITLEADAINAIQIISLSGSLIDLCYVPVAQDATLGWERIGRFSYPMGLPVLQPEYPCSAPNPAALLAARAPDIAAQLPNWNSDTFDELKEQLYLLVENGPNGLPMADRMFFQTIPDPSTPDPNPPKLSKIPVLDLVLLGALHPSLARLIGLYWIDQSVAENVAYDYLIVADHTGVGQLNADKILATIQATGFTQLDGYILFKKSKAAEPPLPAPATLESHILPGGYFPNSQGVLPQAINNAGLRWKIVEDSAGELLPASAVMYLVWRADLGNGPTAAPTGAYNLITKTASGKPKPILVTEPRWPKGVKPQRPAKWPKDPLHFIDRNLKDGWYNYQVSGIDLFGRHSANSPPVQVRLLDDIPPPMPTGVEAYALDPDDPFLLKDQTYIKWYGKLRPMHRSIVGLRVRWRWTKAHQRQAPDTREFRLYFHPGPDLPPNHDQAANWQERYHVVAYNENFTIGTDDELIYEVLLPPPAMKNITSIALTPSLAEPVVYAHIAVAAADDKTHTIDLRKTGNWSNRPGNEGCIGPPAKIYRVLRDKPTPPVALADLESVYASPADYHNRSYYTYRWQPPKMEENLKLHLFRAMDDAIIKTDWLIRTTRFALDPENALHKRFFSKWGGDLNRQKAAAKELNAITLLSNYDTLSTDAKELLVRLPGNDGDKIWDKLKNRDWSLRQTRQNLSANDLKDFPNWDSAKCQAVATELNAFVLTGNAATAAGNKIKLDGAQNIKRVRPYHDTILLKSDTKSVNRQYRIIAKDLIAGTLTLDDAPVLTGGNSAWMIPLYQTLSDSSLRALAYLPENEQAFTQITIDPLDSFEVDPGDTTKLRWRDRKGPDNAEDFLIDENARRAYIDTLDGQSTNRYLYRAVFVDGAHNRGEELGLSGPVVYLPNVAPPRVPVITKILSAESDIIIKWAFNREPDLAAYRVYRTENEDHTRDIRLMDLAVTINQADVNLSAPGVEWADKNNLIGGHKYYYRLTAADTVGNESEPTRVLMGIAVDTRVPSPPTWTEQTWLLHRRTDDTFINWPTDDVVPAGYEPVLRLGWQCDTPAPEFVVRRWSEQDQVWTKPSNIAIQASSTKKDSFILLDSDVNLTPSAYRLKVRSSSCVWATEEAVLAITLPASEQE